jgi:beta-glucosidase/6-phospho-beta-glucosidase/beta-galactosidase
VHVDFDSQRRTPKASALWYSDVIAANAVTGP